MQNTKNYLSKACITITMLASSICFAVPPTIHTIINNDSRSNIRVITETKSWLFSDKKNSALPSGSTKDISAFRPAFSGDYATRVQDVQIFNSMDYPYHILEHVEIFAFYNIFAELTDITCVPVLFSKVTCDVSFLNRDEATVLINVHNLLR